MAPRSCRSCFKASAGGTFVIPGGSWDAGGEGTATLTDQQLIAGGGRRAVVQSNAGKPDLVGWIFTTNPLAIFGRPGDPGAKTSYVPGQDTDWTGVVLVATSVAAGVVGGAIIGAGEAGAGAGAAGGAAAAGEGAVGPAEAGLVAAGSGGAAAATGGGLTTAGVISAAQTAGGVISAAGTVAKLAGAVTAHASAADALQTSAQQQAALGNVAAAQALQNQATVNAGYALGYQTAAGTIAEQAGLQIPGLSSNIAGVPFWAWLIGGGMMILLTQKRR